MIDHPLDSLDRPFVSTAAIFIENPHPHQLDARRNPVVFAIGAFLAVGDNARYVRSVAVGIFREVFTLDIILPGDNSEILSVDILEKALMPAQTRIYNRNCNAGAISTLAPNHIRPNNLGVIGSRDIVTESGIRYKFDFGIRENVGDGWLLQQCVDH